MSKELITSFVLGFCLVAIGHVGSARAADCVMHYKRVACAGQEAEAYKKCAGKQECDEENSTATTEEACMKASSAACENSRPEITKSKAITSAFKGKALKGGFAADGKPDASGPNFCAADRPDFNKCK
jgi:hypothetical protein